MQNPSSTASGDAATGADDGGIVQGLLERGLAGDSVKVPQLPDVAVRVVRAGPRESSNASRLAQVIGADPALTRYVLRIAASAAKRPATPILTLPHAVAWLGFDEVANIAFTLALQGKMLDVKGQQHKARRLWRHSLASALWSRQLAHMLSRETGLCYLCGLLHDIGKVVSLGAAHDAAQGAGRQLAGDEYDRLIEIFHRQFAARVTAAWRLPAVVRAAAASWDAYAAAGAARFECNVVNVAHTLADFTMLGSTQLTRDALVTGPAYRDLGLSRADAGPLFDSAAAVNSELDRYLAP